MTRSLLPLALGAAVIAATVHAGQITPHAAEHPLLAQAFLASVLFGAGWVLAAAMAPRARWLLLAGLVGHLLMVAVGGWSRTVGLPGEGVEPRTGPWVVAMVAEAVVVACCWLLVREQAPDGRLPVAAGEPRGEVEGWQQRASTGRGGS